MQKPFIFYLVLAGTFSIYRIYMTHRGGFDWNLESSSVTDMTSKQFRLIVFYAMLSVYVLASGLMICGRYKM
jgi:hypothetical protein